MGKISSYPLKDAFNPNDKVVGTDSEVAELDSTKNFDIGQMLNTDLTVFYNNTGSTITKCTPVSRGTTVVDDIAVGIISDSADQINSLSYLGLAINDVPDGEIGYAMERGILKGCDTSGIPIGFLYLGPSGTLVNERPNYPHTRVAIGGVTKVGTTDGEITLGKIFLPRNDASKSYHFTNTGVGSGTFYMAGYYDFDTDDANLDEVTTSVSYGDQATRIKAAHPAIVAGGPGTVVGGGQVGLRAVGILDDEVNGGQTAAQNMIITEDITTLELDNYYEATEKASGIIDFELYVVSGSPTAYSLDFNYGFAKYDDFQDRDFTITGFEAVFRGDTNNSTAEIALLHHKQTGWTYAATNFEPGNGAICRRTTDQPLTGRTDNNVYGAYKRTELSTFIEGEGSEGVIIQIVTGASNTFQGCSLHVKAVSEELIR